MLAKKLNSPLTSSAGRLFDAVAAIIDCGCKRFEGQAAMELGCVRRVETDEVYAFELFTINRNGSSRQSSLIGRQ
jgi:hydrogenase maturation protein HypF